MDDGGGHHQSGADSRLYGCVGGWGGGGERGKGFTNQVLISCLYRCVYMGGRWAVVGGGGRHGLHRPHADQLLEQVCTYG